MGQQYLVQEYKYYRGTQYAMIVHYEGKNFTEALTKFNTIPCFLEGNNRVDFLRILEKEAGDKTFRTIFSK